MNESRLIPFYWYSIADLDPSDPAFKHGFASFMPGNTKVWMYVPREEYYTREGNYAWLEVYDRSRVSREALLWTENYKRDWNYKEKIKYSKWYKQDKAAAIKQTLISVNIYKDRFEYLSGNKKLRQSAPLRQTPENLERTRKAIRLAQFATRRKKLQEKYPEKKQSTTTKKSNFMQDAKMAISNHKLSLQQARIMELNDLAKIIPLKTRPIGRQRIRRIERRRRYR